MVGIVLENRRTPWFGLKEQQTICSARATDAASVGKAYLRCKSSRDRDNYLGRTGGVRRRIVASFGVAPGKAPVASDCVGRLVIPGELHEQIGDSNIFCGDSDSK